MGNLCSFTMLTLGEKKNIEKFFLALSQKGSIWIGRGADACLFPDEEGGAIVSGACNNSMYSAFVTNAVQMQRQKVFGKGP